MPNSDFTVTRTELINAALRKVGNRSPSVDEQNEASAALNKLVKRIDAQGRWLWCVDPVETSLTLSASTRRYTAGAGAGNIATGILAFESVWLLKGTAYQPIRVITKKEAINTYEREGTGEPYLVHLERNSVLASQAALFYPTPNATLTVKYHYRRRLYDFDAASDNPDMPGEWIDALETGLAWKLSPEYGLPLEDRNTFRDEYNDALRIAKKQNAEEAPDERAYPDYF